MSQPTPYSRQFDFTDWSATRPSDQQPGTSLDAELNAVKVTLDAVLANLVQIQRDDGALKNSAVTLDTLATDVLTTLGSGQGWTPRGAWVTATAYEMGDVVAEDGSTYVATVAHTSGTFSTDEAADKWVPIFGAVASGSIADGAVTTAKIADGAVTTAKLGFTSLTLSGSFSAQGGFADGQKFNGNAGIGATPPTWSAFKALSLGSSGNFIAGSSGTTLALGVNAYYDGTDWRRPTDLTASTKFLADSTTFLWSFAAAGAAGGVATFADRMRLTQNSFGGGMLDLYGAAGVLAIRLDTSGTITSTGTYSTTTLNAANMYVHSDGSFMRSTSSLRFKDVLEPVADEWAYKILDAEGIFYKSLCAADNPDWTYYGFGAETIAQLDPRWVFWRTTDEAGEPLAEPVADGVQYERMVVALQHIAKREKARADEAEARLNAIEARLAAAGIA
ncbi:hypothetical protein BSL82_15665 [Tardibacter chloracetimidivorans]|uniref:Peptidase S74 domain-containing protein n=1 Tax=Tardibacter chloracetimidivorans TaxID=1921510 RepID=A0A1L3ZY40_9SPHN|nr:hypothetical protein [Tardibacter chloracetimidivorans]API60542.1 hypothetical protein BSL82_15665 [Tardibacter chloracetimidivorans]